MSLSPFREMFTTTRSPPPLPPRKKPVPSEARQSGCTHKVMTRLYDQFDASACSVCHRHPSFGWLYRCTQDTDGFLPRSDFSDDAPMGESRMRTDQSLCDLSPATFNAINQGQYTIEQTQKLLRQKKSVHDAIQSDTRPTTSSSTTEESMTFSTIPESTTFSTNTSTSLDEELRAAYDWQTLHKVWQVEATRQEAQEQRIVPTDPKIGSPISACGFKICPTCRPTYRERAFQSLDDVLKNPKWPPQWELDNRRVSDAAVVRHIGHKKPHRFYAQTSGQDIDSQNTFSSQYPSSHDDTYLERDTAEENESRRHSRSGFRETVRNALKRARSDQSTTLDKSSASKAASTNAESLTPFRRSMIFMRRKSRPSMTISNGSNRLVVNESLQNSLNLMVATNTPLPPSGPTTPTYPSGQLMFEGDNKHKRGLSIDEEDIIAHA